MKNKLSFLLAVIFFAQVFNLNAQSSEITKWTFDIDGDLTPSIGNGTLALIGGVEEVSQNNALRINEFPDQSTGSGTAGIELSISTEGFENLEFAFSSRTSGTASRWAEIEYSINEGTDWILIGNNNGGLTPDGEYYDFDFDLTACSACNDNSDFKLRVVSIFSPIDFNPEEPNVNYTANTAYHRSRISGGSEYAPGGNWRFRDVVLSGEPIAPFISVDENTLDGFFQILPNLSNALSFNVEGFNLTDNITIDAPTGFEISLNENVGFTNQLILNENVGLVSETEIFVRLNQSTIGDFVGSILLSSSNATDATVSLEGMASSPTNPIVFDLSSGNFSFTEWDSLAAPNTYPANIRFWTSNENDAELPVTFGDDWKCVYNLGGRSRILGLESDGIGFINTGNTQRAGDCDGSNPGQGEDIVNGRAGALVVSLNTTGRQSIAVNWIGRTILVNSREYAIRMQYRVGDGNNDANADWMDFSTPVQYNRQQNNGDFQSMPSVVLPSVCNNQPFVQLRWVYFYIETGVSGQRTFLAVDDIDISSDAIGTPTIVATPSTLNTFIQEVGTPSLEQTFEVEGAFLSSDITITAPAPFEISTTSGSNFQTSINLSEVGGTIAQTTIYVRMNANAFGNFSETINLESGAVSATVNLIGEAIDLSTIPTLFINEFMASNSETIADEFNEFDDWIEIYNPQDTIVDLAGMYISDNPNNLTKFQFPTGNDATIIPPNGFILVWADDQPQQGPLHTNFKLSGSGEFVGLLYTDGITVLDSITFGPQTTDISFGRETDGGVPWVFFGEPTPGRSNSDSGVSIFNVENQNLLKIYPNPVMNTLYFTEKIEGILVNTLGQKIVTIQENEQSIDVSKLQSGVYFIKTLDGKSVSFLKH